MACKTNATVSRADDRTSHGLMLPVLLLGRLVQWLRPGAFEPA